MDEEPRHYRPAQPQRFESQPLMAQQQQQQQQQHQQQAQQVQHPFGVHHHQSTAIVQHRQQPAPAHAAAVPFDIETLGSEGTKLYPDFADDLTGMRDEMLPQGAWLGLSALVLVLEVFMVSFMFARHDDYKVFRYDYYVAGLVLACFGLVFLVLGTLANGLLGTVHSRIVVGCHWQAFALQLAAGAFILPAYETRVDDLMKAAYVLEGLALALQWLLVLLLTRISVNPWVDREQFERNAQLESDYAKLLEASRYNQTLLAQSQAEVNSYRAELQRYKAHVADLAHHKAHGKLSSAEEYNELVDLLADTKKQLEKTKLANSNLRRNNEQLRQQLQDHGIRAMNFDSEKRRMSVQYTEGASALEAQVRDLTQENVALKQQLAQQQGEQQRGQGLGVVGGVAHDEYQALAERYRRLEREFSQYRDTTSSEGFGVGGSLCPRQLCKEREKTMLLLSTKLEMLTQEKDDLHKLAAKNEALQRSLRDKTAKLQELRRWQTQVEAYFGSKVSQLHEHMNAFHAFTENVGQKENAGQTQNLKLEDIL